MAEGDQVTAAQKLFLGTALVVVFSDPMVDVMSEIGVRTGVPAFYASIPARWPRRPFSSCSQSMVLRGKKTADVHHHLLAARKGRLHERPVLPRRSSWVSSTFKGIAWQYTVETRQHRLRAVGGGRLRAQGHA